MHPKIFLPLALLTGIASASRLSARGLTCQPSCHTEQPQCKNGMFALQSATGPCWSCCTSDVTFCTQECNLEPPNCGDGFAPTKNGDCYTCCRAPPVPARPSDEPAPLPTIVPRAAVGKCDRQCAPSPPSCAGGHVPFQPGGADCWACCHPKSVKPAEPKTCDRACFVLPPENCGVGKIPFNTRSKCWSCCVDPSLE